MLNAIYLWFFGTETEDRAATTVEYALMISAIAVVLVAGIMFFGSNLQEKWDELSSFVNLG